VCDKNSAAAAAACGAIQVLYAYAKDVATMDNLEQLFPRTLEALLCNSCKSEVKGLGRGGVAAR